MNIFIIIFLVGIIVRIIIQAGIRLPKIRMRRYRKPSINIFEHSYIESKSFYVYRFKNIPSTTYVDDIDIGKAFAHINESYKNLVINVHQSNHYNWYEKTQQFQKTLFVLSNQVIVELGPYFAKILYAPTKFDFAGKLLNELSAFKLPEKERDFE